MRKGIWILIFALVLSGCSLARGTWEGGTSTEDKLVGMYFSFIENQPGVGFRDLWDEEAAGMGPIHLEENVGRRLYAERVLEHGIPYYRFPENCGLAVFHYEAWQSEEVYAAMVYCDPETEDQSNYTDLKSSGSTAELEVTLHTRYSMDYGIYMSPIYMDAEGRAYVLGIGMEDGVDARAEGLITRYSQTGEVQYGGYVYTETTIAFGVEVEELPETYRLLELDDNHRILKEVSLRPEELPEVYTPEGETAYLLLIDGETRTVCNRDRDRTLPVMTPGQYGFLIHGATRIDWEG